MISRTLPLCGLAGVADLAISDTEGRTILFSVTATDAVDAVVDDVELFLLCPMAAPDLEEDDCDARAAAAATSVSCCSRRRLFFLLLASLSGDMKTFLHFLTTSSSSSS